MLNTGQVALLCRPIDGGEFRAVNRQLQHWVGVGVVPPAGGRPNTGKGYDRRYDGTAALLAAIAVSLGRWKIPGPVIKLAIGALLRREVKPDPKWQGESGRLAQIIAGKSDLVLVLQHVDEDGPRRALEYFFMARREVGEFLASDEFGAAGGSNAIVIDVPRLWRTVSAFGGFEPQAGPAIHAAVEPQ